MFNKFIPTKKTIISIYALCIPFHCVYFTYKTANDTLDKFENNKLSNYENSLIHSKTDAINYGIYHNSGERIVSSFFWPYSVILYSVDYYVNFQLKNKTISDSKEKNL